MSSIIGKNAKMTVDGKDFDFVTPDPDMDQVASMRESLKTQIVASVSGTFMRTDHTDDFFDDMRKQHEAEVQETLAQIRKELQDELMKFTQHHGKKGRPLTMKQMQKKRNQRKIKAIIRRKMMDLYQREMIALPGFYL